MRTNEQGPERRRRGANPANSKGDAAVLPGRAALRAGAPGPLPLRRRRELRVLVELLAVGLALAALVAVAVLVG